MVRPRPVTLKWAAVSSLLLLCLAGENNSSQETSEAHVVSLCTGEKYKRKDSNGESEGLPHPPTRTPKGSRAGFSPPRHYCCDWRRTIYVLTGGNTSNSCEGARLARYCTKQNVLRKRQQQRYNQNSEGRPWRARDISGARSSAKLLLR